MLAWHVFMAERISIAYRPIRPRAASRKLRVIQPVFWKVGEMFRLFQQTGGLGLDCRAPRAGTIRGSDRRAELRAQVMQGEIQRALNRQLMLLPKALHRALGAASAGDAGLRGGGETDLHGGSDRHSLNGRADRKPMK